jgi:hypothetical protein
MKFVILLNQKKQLWAFIWIFLRRSKEYAMKVPNIAGKTAHPLVSHTKNRIFYVPKNPANSIVHPTVCRSSRICPWPYSVSDV